MKIIVGANQTNKNGRAANGNTSGEAAQASHTLDCRTETLPLSLNRHLNPTVKNKNNSDWRPLERQVFANKLRRTHLRIKTGGGTF